MQRQYPATPATIQRKYPEFRRSSQPADVLFAMHTATTYNLTRSWQRPGIYPLCRTVLVLYTGVVLYMGPKVVGPSNSAHTVLLLLLYCLHTETAAAVLSHTVSWQLYC